MKRAKFHENELSKDFSNKEEKYHKKLMELYLHLYEKEKLKGEKR